MTTPILKANHSRRFIYAVCVGLATFAVSTLNAATFTSGYVIGGLGPAFIDTAAAGGNDSSTASDLGFVVQSTNLWQIGQQIRITGIALPLRGGTSGTWTVEFYDLNLGATNNSFDGRATETLVGSALATMPTPSIGPWSVVFDTPIVFTAASTGIAVRFTNASPGTVQVKIQASGFANQVRLNTTTGVAIGGASPQMRFTIAGSVVVPPPVGALLWQGNLSTNWDASTTNWNRHLGGYAFTPTNYTDNGSSGPLVVFDDTLNATFLRTNINLTTGTPLRPSSLVLANSAYRYTFSGPGKFTGATSLTNNGSGVTTFSNANDYTGGSVLNNGRIRLGSAASLGTGPITFANGGVSAVGSNPLAITNSVTLGGSAVLGDTGDNGALTFSGPMDFGGTVRSLTVPSDVVLSGALTNGGISSKAGLGTLTITGQDATTNGTWSIVNGVLKISGTSGPGSISSLTIGAGSANGVAMLIITNGASVTVNSSASSPLRIGAQGQSSSTSSNYMFVAGTFRYATNVTGVIQLGNISAYDELDLFPGSLLRVGGLTYSAPGITVLNLNGGTIAASANNTTNFMTGHTAVNLLGTGVTFDTEAYNIGIAQPLSGSGGLTKQGIGMLTLTGASTYTGSTIVQTGTLALVTYSTGNSALVVSNGATVSVTINSGTPAIPSLSLNGATVSVEYGDLNGSASATTAINNSGVGTGVLTLTGVNTIQLTGQNLGVGVYPIIALASIAGSGSFNPTPILPFGCLGVVQTNGTTIQVNITTAPKLLTWYGSTDGGATQNNNWNLSNLNWYDPSFMTTNYNDYGVIGDSVTFNSSSVTNNVNIVLPVRPAKMTVDASSGDFAFSTTSNGKLTGLGSLVKIGAGALTLLTTNDFSGGSVVSNGVIRLGNNSALGIGTISVNGGGLSSDGAVSRSLTNAITFGGSATLGDAVNTGLLTLSGSVNFAGGARSITVNSPATVSGAVTNGGLDQKLGADTLTYNGVTGQENLGNWQVQNGNFIISGGNLTKSGGAVRIGNVNANGVSHLVLTNGAQVFITGSGQNLRVGNDQAPSADPTSTNILDVAGTLAWTTNSGGTVLMGAAGAFAQINVFSGGLLKVAGFTTNGTAVTEMNFLGGTLGASANNTNFLNGLTTVNIGSAGGTINTDTNTITIGQSLIGGGALTKTGNGTLLLNGNHSYAGLTTVSAGSLGGSGTISGAVSIGASGTLSPGNSIGTLTVGSLASSGNIFIEVNKSQSPSNDVVNVTGALTYGGALIATNSGASALVVGDSFKVFNFGSQSGNITVAGSPGAGLAWSLNKTTGTLSVVSGTAPTLAFTQTGSNLQFTWTGSYKLQWQTNSLAVGLRTNWVDYPSGGSSGVSVPITTTNACAFFRLSQ